MKYLVLVSHGGLAEGLKTSLAMFAGDKLIRSSQLDSKKENRLMTSQLILERAFQD